MTDIPEDIRKMFREWGAKGGQTRRDRTTPEKRSAIARKAAKAMWKKRKKA